MASQAKADDEAQQTTTADVSTLFEDDGRLVPAEEAAKRTNDSPDNLEEWLAEANPTRHAKYEKAVRENMFPNTTDAELLHHSVQKEIEQAEADGRNITPTTGKTVPQLEIVHTQDDDGDERYIPPQTQDLSWLPELAQELATNACINAQCDSKHVQSHQMQMGGADEGMTGFHTCQECGETWKTGYGA